MDSPRASAPGELGHWERLAEEFAANGWYHSIELPDGRVIEGLQSLEQQKRRLETFPIPEDLTGKRVLDIGTWDGWFAFEMERRGAEVMAIDCVEQPAFHLAYDLLGSKVDYRVMDVADLSVERVGRFDIVLFFGVLYHLKHPLLALEKVCEVTKDLALVESFVTGGEPLPEDQQQRPSMEFYETGELCGRLDNWVGPNTQCLLAFCRTAGFARVELVETLDQRAHVVCRRHWRAEPGKPSHGPPRIHETINIRTTDRYADSSRDEYLMSWFDSEAPDLTVSTVLPEVGGYGVQPIYVGHRSGKTWQVNFKLPPGLGKGRHPVRLRTRESAFSEPVEMAVDLEQDVPKPHRLTIVSVTDADSYKPGCVRLAGATWISLWVEGLREGTKREHVRVRLGEAPLPVDYVSEPDDKELRQLNVRLPESTVPGDYSVRVVCAGTSSLPARLEVIPRKTG